MASVLHIAEVAAIIALAYALGWAVGYFAHRFAARPSAPTIAPAVEVSAASANPGSDALVKAPVIAPVPTDPLPPPVAALAAEPVPAAIDAAAIAPQVADTAAQNTSPEASVTPVEPPPAPSLTPIKIPPMPAPPPLRIDPVPSRVKPLTIPEPEPEPEVVLTATPAVRPGEAWSGEVRGKSAAAAISALVSSEPLPETVVELPAEVPFTLELTETIPFVSEPEPTVQENGDSQSAEPVALAIAEAPPIAATYDEEAAMRAIEGGWSRTGARALSGTPELSDVGAAVAAAQTAVEQVLARAGIDAGASQRAARPDGLAKPRPGGKDDLKRINGLGALDESTLNNLGVFHFDQIAGWDDAQVLWMENHVFARGRIGREGWQAQAKELAAAVAL